MLLMLSDTVSETIKLLYGTCCSSRRRLQPQLGGWLAPEVLEYLLGCPQVDEKFLNLLWSYKRKGRFEEALVQLQADPTQRRDTAQRSV